MYTFVSAFLLLLQAAQTPEATQNRPKPRTAVPLFSSETPAQYWDRAYSNPNLALPTTPNRFLTEVVRDLKPGRALDIGIGQGRNSIYLAMLGWDVTGFDISEKGLEQSRRSAAAAGVKITTIHASMEDFDFGVDRWDLIVATYEGVGWLDGAVKGLKPGGSLVVEGYGRHPDAPPSAVFGPNELPRLCLGHELQILRYEDVAAEPDWLKLDRVVRMLARKPN